MRGYFGIGIENNKSGSNIGTLWRSAYIFEASFIFTINRRYEKQGSDTMKTWRSIPLYNYKDFDEFYNTIPYDCKLVGIEILENAKKLSTYNHPERCIYLLGAEDHGLSNKAIEKCHNIVVLPGKFCLNVSVAGSIVMYDRLIKNGEKNVI